jgi:hypothetical protein
MNKIITIIAFAIALSLSALGQDAPLQDYTGKYNFPEGSPVPNVEMKLVEGVLIGESQMGSSTFTRIEGDKFTIVEYNGTAEFIRNAEGKVISIKVTVDTMVLEGTKEAAAFRSVRFNPLSPLRIR